MVEVIPFRGILYNQDEIKEIEKVVAPPYDVVSPKEQDIYYSLHPYNVIRLILGKEFSGDNESNNRYTRAAKFFEDWLRKGILKKDEFPSFYIYEVEYPFKNVKKKRIGFIGLIKLRDFGQNVVFPHENTLKEPKLDRLKLIEEARANLSPIFSLFEDTNHKIDKLLELWSKTTPILDIETTDKIRHRLWRLYDSNAIEEIKDLMAAKKIFIADGHHRYEVALEFRNKMCKEVPNFSGNEGWNYVMMYFTNTDGKSLVILPTHRLINILDKIDLDGIMRFFKVDIYDQKDKLFPLMEDDNTAHKFGMYDGNNKYYLLTLKDEKLLDGTVGLNKLGQREKLSVVILHELVLNRVLNVNKADIVYTQDADLAIKMVDEGKYKAVFFLNPTKITDVINIAISGERIPQKVTYFYPKLLTGLVMNKFNEDTI